MTEEKREMYEEYRRKKKEDERVEVLAEQLASYLNTLNGKASDRLVKELTFQHRTLQQRVTLFALRWLYHLSRLKESEYDLRLQASVDIAKEIADVLGWNDIYKPSLPLV